MTSVVNQSQFDEDKNPPGRPLKFRSAEDLRQKIDAYLGSCKPHVATRKVFVRNADGGQYLADEEYITDPQPPTTSGLCVALDTTRDVLLDYESGKYDEKAADYEEGSDLTFSNVMKSAKLRIISEVERRMLSGEGSAAGAIFWLKNVDHWTDRQAVDHTSGGGPVKALVEIIDSGARTGKD